MLGFAGRKMTANLGRAAGDGLIDARGGIEFTVEHNTHEAAGTSGGDITKFLGTLRIKIQVNLVAAELVSGSLGVLNGIARHFGNALNQIVNGVGLAVCFIVLILAHDLIARGHIGRRLAHGARVFHHKTEAKHRWLLDVCHDVGVIACIEASELDLDAGIAHRANHRLGHAHPVNAIANNFDRLAELLAALVVTVLGIFFSGRCFEGESNAAFQVEAELQWAFRLLEQIGQEDVVALLDVLQGTLEFNIRKILR